MSKTASTLVKTLVHSMMEQERTQKECNHKFGKPYKRYKKHDELYISCYKCAYFERVD